MKNEKVSNIILIIVCFALIGVIAILYDKAFLSNEVVTKSNVVAANNNHNKTIAIMYETGVESGEYVASNETTWPSEGYVFNTALSKCENGSSISYDGTNVKVLASKSDRCYVYFDREVITLANYIKRLYSTENEGENGLYLHDEQGKYTNYELEAGDGSYRYAGASDSVNNYICLGSIESVCPEKNTFRIIGVFDSQVKVIKNTSLGAYTWVTSGTNEWATSTLNTEVLNETYLNSLTFSSLIEAPSNGWQVGGNTDANVIFSNAKDIYTNEIINPVESIKSANKIGLVYASDYMYAADPVYWNYPGNSEDSNDYRLAINNNWMYQGLNECTITRRDDNDYGVVFINGGGYLHRGDGTRSIKIRPTFYLTSSVIYTSGTGTSTNMFYIQ